MLRVMGDTPGGEMRVKNRYFPSRVTNGQNSVPAVFTAGPRLRGRLNVPATLRKLTYRSIAPRPSGRFAAKMRYRSSGSTNALDAPESALTVASSGTGAVRLPSLPGAER